MNIKMQSVGLDLVAFFLFFNTWVHAEHFPSSQNCCEVQSLPE